MIGLLQNDLRYDYDIRTLLQAFYANEKIVPNENDVRMLMRVAFTEGGQHTIWFKDEEGNCYKEQFRGNYQDKMELRNTVKEAVYHILVQATGRTLPWGTLTGIRSVKIITGLLEEGKTPAQAAEQFQKTYLTTWQKADISTRIAIKEEAVLQQVDYKDQYSLYIGIPFCPSTCLYCSFTSYPIARYQAIVEDYLQALFKEIAFVAEQFRDRKLITIYIGGGTPTSLSASQLQRLIQYVQEQFSFADLKEFTVEAGRPDSITEEKLQVLYNSPVTRISINPQTMQQETLRLIGRAHTTEQTVAAYELARKIGFTDINMDLIVGLPGEGLAEVEDTLRQIEQLAPDNLTVHSLAIKRAARLNIQREEYMGYVRGSTNEMLMAADAAAARMGLEPYYLYRQKNIPGNLENIGYAAAHKEGLYNILIMEEKQTIAAVGAGSSSKYVFPKENRIMRTENVKEVEQYISRIEEMIARKQKMLLEWKNQ